MIANKKVTEVMLADMNEFVDSLTTELGFPCIHRRQKKYLVPNVNEKLDTWQLVSDKYVEFKTAKIDIRKMAYKTFYRYKFNIYFHFIIHVSAKLRIYRYMKASHPDFTLSRKKEDECDTCIRLEISLANKAITADNRIALIQEQRDHWEAARTQRLFMKEAIKVWGRETLKSQATGTVEQFEESLERLSDFLENASQQWDAVAIRKDEVSAELRVLLIADDFAGNLIMPWFGKGRCSKDYYVSNLNLYMQVVACLSTGQNYIYLYDERSMGKDYNAICSLRFKYHIDRMQEYKAAGRLLEMPDTLFTIHDNCVGQNKSQVVLKFYCWLSLTFFKKVAVLYLVSGHSHFAPDRTTSNAKSSIGAYSYVFAIVC